MPRPTKCRRVCYFPEVLEFSPTGAVSGEPIVLTFDEPETILRASSFSFVAAVQTFAIKKTASNGKFKKNTKQKKEQIL